MSRSRRPSQSMSAAFGMFWRSEKIASPRVSLSVSAISSKVAPPVVPVLRYSFM